MGAFNRLPTELLFMIMSHLDRKDKKTFRLLDPRCSPMPLPILFRSIGFSRLRRDRDAFEMIAAHPHLAVHVRELVWWELQLEAWDPSYRKQATFHPEFCFFFLFHPPPPPSSS